jgi:hypothetical protein
MANAADGVGARSSWRRSPAFLAILAFAFAIAIPFATHATGSRNFEGLQPGRFVVHRQAVPIRIVLIGFKKNQVDEEALEAWLPETYAPLVRYPQFYGLDGRNMGLKYRFRHSIVYKDRQFTNAFFAHLRQIGKRGGLTDYQKLYNDQERNVLDIKGPVLYIDAASVEKWLEHADTGRDERGYTIYFINWHGRDDFRFHVYTKVDDPDPDTHFNFGALDEAAMVAWGGTSSRSWFYDFSAGPEWNSVNWLVDFEDLSGDGFAEYRMPNIWEYVAGGYREPDALGGDMGLLARFVAINLLFTSSPLYDPLVTAPGPRGAKVAHITLFEDDPASSGAKFLDREFAGRMWQDLQPYYRWKVGLKKFDPIDAASKSSLDIFAGNSDAGGCWEEIGDPFAQLFCHFDQNLAMYAPAYGRRDYVGEIFAFNTTEAGLGFQFGLLGFADDNWVDGTQTYSFVFGADAYREFGYGLTSTAVHELGHHHGLSHPHDGYDSELGIDYGAGGDLYFAWLGDESDTVMQYIAVSNGFGRHNADNMHRWEMAGYLNWANALAGDILGSGRAWRVSGELERADRRAAAALAAFRDWNYLRAVSKAREAYSILSAAADDIGVTSATLAAARMPLPGYQPVKEGCRPRLLEERLRKRQ